MGLRILIAPSGFKESLSAEEEADCIEAGLRRVLPAEAAIVKVPMPDGGEGFARTLVGLQGGTLHQQRVTGPIGEPVEAYFGLLDGPGPRTAVLEMAAAAGLRLVPPEARDPLRTTTYGVGELIRAALDAGAERILLGCGDSGTNDGGAGLAQALGVRLLASDGGEIGRGGGELVRLARIDLTGRAPRLGTVPIEVACNWHNVLCGERGVARVFGPQKGAGPEAVEQLESGLETFASVIERDLGIDVRHLPGGGASGGTGAGLHALLGAELHPRYEIILRHIDIDRLLAESDLVLTAEGMLDFHTARGKIPAELAERSRRLGVPVIAFAGTLAEDASRHYDAGIDAMFDILERPCSLAEAIEESGSLLTKTAERAMRALLIGGRLHEAGKI